MLRRVDVLYIHPGGHGWYPIQHMARLLAQTFDGKLVELPDPGRVTRFQQVLGQLPRLRSLTGEHLIVVAPNPVHLAHTVRYRHWFPGYSSVQAWVIDSFWDERVPRMAVRRNHFDKIWITDGELVATWQERVKAPVGWLPWGADTVVAGALMAARPIDVQRVGRQPAPWDDDATNQALARQLDVVYGGRPPYGETLEDNQRHLYGAMAAAKYVLAFSNLASPADYTHPTREYLTGRWTDSLAHGAKVVGQLPQTMTTQQYLWPECSLEVPADDPAAGFEILSDALRTWTPEAARHTHAMARQRLDWRWRFSELADFIGNRPAKLDDALAELSGN